MLELAARIDDALAAGRRVAVATVVRVDGSAPREVGAAMFVDDAGAVVGSISGGCVEGAVVEVCERVLEGSAPEVARFGISDEQAFSVGLSCGGEIDVFVRPVESADASLAAACAEVRADKPAVIATVIAGPVELLGLRLDELSDAALVDAGVPELNVARLTAERDARLVSGRSGLLAVPCATEQVEIFYDVHRPAARMLVYGAVDFSAALAEAARLIGYRVTVCDARPLFATRDRFPGADEVIVDWPHRHLTRLLEAGELDSGTVVISLTHDAKFDIPLLALALEQPVAYVGAMGSRRTHERRVAALRETGLGDEQLARLHSPIGLDLGAATPEETAVSILAEVIAARTGASATPLSRLTGPIHRSSRAPGPSSRADQ